MTKHSDQTLWMTDDRYLRTDHCSVVYAIIWKFIAAVAMDTIISLVRPDMTSS